MKGKRILVILLSIMMLFTTSSPTMIMATSPDNTGDNTTTSEEAAIPANILTYTNFARAKAYLIKTTHFSLIGALIMYVIHTHNSQIRNFYQLKNSFAIRSL